MPKFVSLLFVIWTLMVIGCGGPSSSNPGVLSKTVEGVKVDVTLKPALMQTSQDTTVNITLTDDKGQPVNDSRVVVSLTAMNMSMTPISAIAESKSNGDYTAVLKPTGHAGPHTLRVNMDWRGKAFTARFDELDVK